MKTNVLTLIITMVVGIILAGSLLGPVISDAQHDLGDPITKSNNALATYYRDLDANDVFELSSDGYELNDVAITKTYRQAIFADSFVLQINKPEDSAIAYVIGAGDTTPVNLLKTNTYSITFEDSTVTVVKDGSTTVFTKEFTWAYIITTSADTASWGTITRVGINPTYILDNTQVILSGYYYTGENDTFYSYKDGELDTGSYEGAIEITKAIVDGTTDIYQVTGLEVTVGEESFTPYLTLVPLSVTGHATAGASYSLLGAIPIMVIVAILMLAVGAIAFRRND